MWSSSALLVLEAVQQRPSVTAATWRASIRARTAPEAEPWPELASPYAPGSAFAAGRAGMALSQVCASILGGSWCVCGGMLFLSGPRAPHAAAKHLAHKQLLLGTACRGCHCALLGLCCKSACRPHYLPSCYTHTVVCCLHCFFSNVCAGWVCYAENAHGSYLLLEVSSMRSH
jgi:hypothetical protein